MPCRYTIDIGLGLVISTGWGRVTFEEMKAHQERWRMTLSEMKLITTNGDRREERLLKSEAEWQAALTDHFGVQVPHS